MGVTVKWDCGIRQQCNCYSAMSCCTFYGRKHKNNKKKNLKTGENLSFDLNSICLSTPLIFFGDALKHWIAKFLFNLCKSPPSPHNNSWCCKVLHTVSQLKRRAGAQSRAPFRFHSTVAAWVAWHQGSRMNNRCVSLHQSGWIFHEGAREGVERTETQNDWAQRAAACSLNFI